MSVELSGMIHGADWRGGGYEKRGNDANGKVYSWWCSECDEDGE